MISLVNSAKLEKARILSEELKQPYVAPKLTPFIDEGESTTPSLPVSTPPPSEVKEPEKPAAEDDDFSESFSSDDEREKGLWNYLFYSLVFSLSSTHTKRTEYFLTQFSV